jgi:hypothetical protein
VLDAGPEPLVPLLSCRSTELIGAELVAGPRSGPKPRGLLLVEELEEETLLVLKSLFPEEANSTLFCRHGGGSGVLPGFAG